MKTLTPYIRLCRIGEQPVGLEFLLMPCLWGLFLAMNQPEAIKAWPNYSWTINIFYAVFLFVLGSLALQSFGCLWNDWVDRKLDASVERTKDRPFAVQSVTLLQTLPLIVVLLFIGALVMFQLPKQTWPIAITCLVMAIVYPKTKYWISMPQVFVGITFNLGIFIGWKIFFPNLSDSVWMLFLGGAILTVIYDTIYGFQDLKDDLLQGVGSVSILVKEYPKTFVSAGYFACLMCFKLAGLSSLTIFFLSALVLFKIVQWKPVKQNESETFYQRKALQQERIDSCAQFFLWNRWIERIVLLSLVCQSLWH